VPTSTATPPVSELRVPEKSPEHFDVVIVGAGLSGIGAACHLQASCPGKTYAILEARATSGGTWDLFRYPGIRSDSDMYTLGYAFRPWKDAKAIADGPSILSYIRETASDNGVDDNVRFNHRVVRAGWSTEDARWTIEAERTDTGETVRFTCGFISMCTGYFRYDQGYTPDFEGIDRFKGTVVHPQLWPEDLDYTGKRVVVIGSGATAVTLVPAMSERAGHVTMLQRSPSYVVTLPAEDPIANFLRGKVSAKRAYSIVRWKNVLMTTIFFNLSRRAPNFMKGVIRRGVQRHLPAGYDVDTHFKPKYNPWDQRVCLVPDGDLFTALKSGKASIVTDQIQSFTEHGLKLASGTELDADIIVTATGLQLLPLGGLDVTVDGKPIDFSETVGYKGMMFSDVPNLAIAIGYTNASWTLKCDLTCEYMCRLLNYMDAHGYRQCTPRVKDPALETQPFIDLMSGYVLRSINKFPKQGTKAPWRLHQNYARDILLLRRGPLEDDGMEFSNRTPVAEPAELIAA
jgi:cation diffusion facilitator CzcD-associated flavoprotein CzcO